MPNLPPPPPWARASQAPSPFGTDSALPAPTDAAQLQQPLPTPPPSVTKKAPTIWDKDHISETLLGIGQAFLSNQNFGEGLGAAAGVMSDRQAGLRRDAQKSVTYGGPNNQFEITADAQGNRTIREVPEFTKAVEAERAAKNAPDLKEVSDARSRVVYAINQLPKDQRAAAYAGVMANPQAYGIDPRGMPGQWDDTYGVVAGNSGLTVNQAVSNVRADRLADNRIATNDARTAQGAQRVALSAQKDARAALKASAPPSVRNGGGAKPAKGYSIIRSRAEFNALPVGSKFIAPDGSKRIKQ
jgi:hypothetical protein